MCLFKGLVIQHRLFNVIQLLTNKLAIAWLLLIFVSCFIYSQYDVSLTSLFSEEKKQEFALVYGDEALDTLQSWLTLIENNQDTAEWKKLRMVNHFFNSKIRFVDDIKHWNKKDYWATPIEFIGTQGGDCEDFAIAKYFTLKAMGVAPHKMRLMYVRALELNQAHMVLIYSENVTEIPLVLDNLHNKILPASKRPDLKPVYSFNGDGLWLAKAKGLGKQVKGKGDVSRWEDIMSRIERGQFITN